jgi:hypothetical protein
MATIRTPREFKSPSLAEREGIIDYRSSYTTNRAQSKMSPLLDNKIFVIKGREMSNIPSISGYVI